MWGLIMDRENDKNLIEKLQQGGTSAEQAFIMIDTELRPIMHGIIKNKFKNIPQYQREDIIQEAMIKILDQLQRNKFRGDSSLKNWAMVIFINKIYDALRKNKSQTNTINELTSNLNLADERYSTNMIDLDCEALALHQFRKENPEDMADLDLIVLGKLDQKQLAAMKEMKHGAMRQRVSILKRNIRAYINDFCKDEE